MTLFKRLKDLTLGKVTLSKVRSSGWPKLEKAHLAAHPHCEVCGGTKSLTVHHIQPFHLHPELELAPDNLITLCEARKNGLNCHLTVGHLGSFKSFNENVIEDAKTWNGKILNRP